ncbi:uncharacterized [Tachysurus ichikawai]
MAIKIGFAAGKKEEEEEEEGEEEEEEEGKHGQVVGRQARRGKTSRVFEPRSDSASVLVLRVSPPSCCISHRRGAGNGGTSAQNREQAKTERKETGAQRKTFPPCFR